MIADIIIPIAKAEGVEKNAKRMADRKPEWGNALFQPSPSQAGKDRCSRQQVYQGLGIPKSESDSGRIEIIFDDSNWHEELIKEWIRKSAYRLHSEQMKVECPPPMRTGSIDGLVTDLLGKDLLLEIKAINHFTFERYWNGGADGYPYGYFTQCAIYLKAIKKINPDITDAILLVKNKNTGNFLEFILHYDEASDTLTVLEIIHSLKKEHIYPKLAIPNIVKDAVDKFTAVLANIEAKTLPVRDYFYDDWHCDYCAWKGKCWENFKDEIPNMVEGIIPDQDIYDAVVLYAGANATINETEKQKDIYKEKIRAKMEQLNCAIGHAGGDNGDYIIKMTKSERETINKELLTPADKIRLVKMTPSIRFEIRKQKPAGEAKPKGKPTKASALIPKQSPAKAGGDFADQLKNISRKAKEDK